MTTDTHDTGAAAQAAGTLPVGAQAPDIELPSDDGPAVRLSDAWRVRPLVLAFLHDLANPFTADHALQLRDGIAAIDGAGAGLAAVCAAPPEAAAEFAARNVLTYPLLCDPGRRAYDAYGAAGASMFVIDAGGVVRWARHARNAADYPPAAPLIEAICAVTGAEPPPPPAAPSIIAPVLPGAAAGATEAPYACAKCGCASSERVQIATAGGFLSRFFNVQHRKFIAVVCSQCGYAELYRRNTGALGNVVDFLGG